jgi:DNA-binding NarL/FixJ family response regulator
MAKRYVVALTDDERAAIEEQEAGPLTRRQRYRVQILLRADAGDGDAEIAEEVGVSTGTVANVRRRFTAGGLDAIPSNRCCQTESLRPA